MIILRSIDIAQLDALLIDQSALVLSVSQSELKFLENAFEVSRAMDGSVVVTKRAFH